MKSHRFSYESCRFCPRNCKVNRRISTGYCQSPAGAHAARAALHFWEEPCISGLNGSGTVFFSGCTLRCCFCQNYTISSEGFGTAVTAGRLSQIYQELEAQGAHNINLVTPTQYLPDVLESLQLARPYLSIPVVYNCGGYETEDTVDALSPFIDIWLPDLKYRSEQLSQRYSGAQDYFIYASAAVRRMIELSGPPVFETFSDGTKSCRIMKKGVIIRHMVLPGHREDSIRLLNWMHSSLPAGHFLISLLSQYTPCYQSSRYPEINRRITTYEYEKVVEAAISLGLTDGFMQKRSSAREEYTPSFALQGIVPSEIPT